MNSKWNKSKIDQEQLRLEIRTCSIQSKLWKLLQEEIGARGHWCAKPRGNPQKGYLVSRKKFKGEK